MKKVVCLLLVSAFLMGYFIFPVSSSENIYKEFYVDGATGDDLNSGTRVAPFKTIQKAQEAAQTVTSGMTGDIVINIASGRYEQTSSIDFTVEDSGLNGYKVIYRGDKDDKPIISGGRVITGFEEAGDGVWKVSLDVPFVRDLCVNGVMADIAKSENKIFGTGHYYKDNTDEVPDGIYVNKADLGLYKNPDDIELKWEIMHVNAVVHIKDLRQDPNDESQVIVEMSNPFWGSVYNDNTVYYSAPKAPGWEIAFSVRNAYEMLDEKGEFYYDKKEKILYYIPRDGEDMSTAEVICPMIDRLVTVRGRGPKNVITNLAFENIKFAHTTWADLDENSVLYNQAEAPKAFFAPGDLTPGAIEVSRTDGIYVTECDFYGLATVALRLFEGVTNATVEGNTFSDIGHGGIVVGSPHDTKEDEPYEGTGAANVFFKKGWTTGVQPNASTVRPYPINANVLDQDYYSSYAWTNEAELKENPDAKSYIRADLGKPYDISSILLDFNDKSLTADGITYEHVYSVEDMSNFEVLVSNDRYFNTYKVVKTFGANGGRRPTINESFNEKFRYVMLRKTKAEPFALTFMRIYSFDEDRVGNKRTELCKNININNNYLRRTGQFHAGAPAITVYYTQNTTVDHNTIMDVPYSGISFGWGWESDVTIAEGNVVSNNHMENVMLQCIDGGPIYTLGNNFGLQVFGNYSKDVLNGFSTYYTDSGSVGFDFYDNVADNTYAAAFLYNSTIKDITVKNTYVATRPFEPFRGTVTEGQGGYQYLEPVINNNPESCHTEPAVYMLPNSYTKEAVEIAYNAGVTDKYAHIFDNVPEKSDVYYDGTYAFYGKGRKSEMRYAEYTNSNKRIFYYDGYLYNVTENGFFGEEVWQYKPELKFLYDDLHERTRQMFNKKVEPTAGVSGWFRGGHIDELFMSKYLVDTYIKSLKHLTYEEMVDICADRIENCVEGAAFGKYKRGAKDELKGALEEAKAMPAETEADKYLRVVFLEDAVNKFDSQKYREDPLYAYMSDGKTEIDKENKTVVITIPKSCDITDVKFMTVGLTEISYDGELELNVPKTLIAENFDVYKANKEWKLIVRKEDFENVGYELSDNNEDWFNSNENTDFEYKNGKLAFQPWLYPYMYKKPVDGMIDFSVKADRADTQDGINFIFSSAAGADLEYDGKDYKKNTYYMMSLMGQDIYVYKVLSGHKELMVKKSDVGFNYGEMNNVSLLCETKDDGDFLTLNLNGKGIISDERVGEIGSAGYFGILTKSVKTEVSVLEDSWSITPSGDEVTVSFNISDEDINSTLFVAFYNENNVLVDIKKESIEKGKYTYDIPYDAKRVAVYQMDERLSPVRFKNEYMFK